MVDSKTYIKLIFRQLMVCLRELFQCRLASILLLAAEEFRQYSVSVEAHTLKLMTATRKLALLGRFDFETLNPSAVVPYPGGRRKYIFYAIT